ncbi:MAG: hypothetical protein HFE83_03800 [Lachnospiraceae bacterium]|nr:hypothetical protein [Lachnospiraceae bacterium]
MGSFSQAIEELVTERGMEQAILIYHTLSETPSIQETAARLQEPLEKIRKIAKQYRMSLPD